MEHLIFGFVFTFSIVEFVWELYLSYRQHQVYVYTTKPPAALEDSMSEEIFLKTRAYSLDKSNYSIFKGIYSAILGVASLWFYAFYYVWEASKVVLNMANVDEGEIKISAIFIVIMLAVSTVVSLPLSIYETFYLEEKHGFNKQTFGFFVKDKIKSIILALVLMVPVVSALIYIVKAGGDYFFIYMWLFSMAMLFFLMSVYPAYIAPLFDKYTPLPDGDLKTQIEELAASVNFPLYKLYLVEGSKRSAHSNAYFYGFFKNKRIVLFDTLLQNESDSDKGCCNDEILAILAHELGHWHYNHVTKNIIIMQVNLLIQFFLFGVLFKYPEIYRAFGFDGEQPVIIGIAIVMMYILSFYNALLGFCLSVLSRSFEFQADGFAKCLGKSECLRRALIKLNKDNLSFPVYDWLYSAWHHSHPPLLERLEALSKED